MVYERVRFETTGILSGNNVNAYIRPIDGKINHIWLNFISGTATGSIFITISGTAEPILTWLNFSADAYPYPRAYLRDVTGSIIGSPNNMTSEIGVRDPIRVIGSGIGAGSQFEVRVYYH